MIKISEEMLSQAENAIISLAEAIEISERDIVEFLEMGMRQDSAKIMGGSMTKSYQYIIDELKAALDVY